MPIIDLNWISGIAIIFGLTLMLTYLTYKDIETFFIFLNIFSGFGVYSGLIPLWILILTLLVLSLIVINNVKKKKMM